MNSLSLYYFAEAAKDLNITQTAKRLFISQQALSDQIKKLEKHYGVAFFERKPKLKLTYQGEQMLSFAKQVIEAEQTLTNSLRSPEHLKRVKLSVAVTNTRSGLLPSILERYLALYPNVIPSIYTGSSDGLITRLQMDRLDVYFGSYRQIHGDYVVEAAGRDELFFLIRQDLLFRLAGDRTAAFMGSRNKGISLADTACFPVTLAPVSAPARTFMDLSFRSSGVTPNVTIENSSNETMFDICTAGLCGAFIMRELVFHHIHNNTFPSDMLCFPLLDLPVLNECGIAYPKGELPEYISDFVMCCKNTIMDAKETVNEYIARQSR